MRSKKTGVERRTLMDGKGLFLRTDFRLSTRIPHPTSLRSATFSPGEGIAENKREFIVGKLSIVN